MAQFEVKQESCWTDSFSEITTGQNLADLMAENIRKNLNDGWEFLHAYTATQQGFYSMGHVEPPKTWAYLFYKRLTPVSAEPTAPRLFSVKD